MEIAKRLKRIRSQTKLSQRAFGEMFGIPKRTIEDWESGRRTPPEYVVRLLEEVTKTDNQGG